MTKLPLSQLLLAAACLALAIATHPAVSAEVTDGDTTYTNPIIEKYLADPCIVHDGDYYYLFATGPAEDGGHIPIHRSKDLKNWEFVRGAVKSAGPEEWNHKHFWAPEAVKIGDTWHLYFTASPKESPANAGNRVGLATSKNVDGPYETVGPVIPHASIDGHPFFDTDGTMYMFYTIEHGNTDGLKAGQIFVDRMTDPRTVAGEPKPLVTQHEWQEGPWLQIRDGRYVLTYSCGNWKNETYHVRYAFADSPTGPFTEQENFILETTDAVKGPGHHSMFQDAAGKDWIVYHGWDPEFKARFPRIDRVFYEKGKVTSDGPTSSPQRLDK